MPIIIDVAINPGTKREEVRTVSVPGTSEQFAMASALRTIRFRLARDGRRAEARTATVIRISIEKAHD